MNTDRIRIVSVTDASRQIGLGHVMRQLSLAQAARKRGWAVHWVSPSPVVGTLAATHAIPHTRVSTLDDVCSELDGDSLFIIDVHQRDFPRLRCEKTAARATLLVSEVGYDFKPYGAHMVFVGSRLDQWATKHTSVHEWGETLQHAGRAWMIFREEFTRKSMDQLRRANHVLVCHGGSDPHRLTEFSLQALALVDRPITVTVLATDAFPALAEVERLAQASPHPCEIVQNALELRAYMESASIAVMNGGNVRYELCVSGTPYVALSFQRTQYTCTQQLSQQGVGVNLGLMTEMTPQIVADAVTKLLDDEKKRQEMQVAMRVLFDSSGADRVLNLLTEVGNE